MKKIFDCITFFDENFMSNLRFEILNKSVDYFVICESRFDHKNRKKKLNFKLHSSNPPPLPKGGGWQFSKISRRGGMAIFF